MGNGLLDYYESTRAPRIVTRNTAIGLGGIFDDLVTAGQALLTKAGVNTNWKQIFADKLNGATLALESKIGTFMTTGQQILDLKAHSDALKNAANPTIASRAQAVSANADALESQFNHIQTQAMPLINTLSSLKNQMSTDPLFGYSDPSQMGTAVIALYNKYSSSVTGALTSVASMIARIDAHNSQVKDLASDVANLESLAQGKGITGFFSGVTSGVGATLSASFKPVAEIAVVGLMAYLLLPSLIPRLARGVRKARG